MGRRLDEGIQKKEEENVGRNVEGDEISRGRCRTIQERKEKRERHEERTGLTTELMSWPCLVCDILYKNRTGERRSEGER